jgi:hypothetical protein
MSCSSRSSLRGRAINASSQPPAGNRRGAAIPPDPSSTIVGAETWASEESAKTAQAIAAFESLAERKWPLRAPPAVAPPRLG